MDPFKDSIVAGSVGRMGDSATQQSSSPEVRTVPMQFQPEEGDASENLCRKINTDRICPFSQEEQDSQEILGTCSPFCN